MAKQRIFHRKGGELQTAGAVSGSVVELDLSSASDNPSGAALNNCALLVVAELVGYVTAGTTNAAYTRKLTAAFKRVATVLSELGADSDIAAAKTDAALTTAVATLDSTGNLVRLRVTGVAGETVLWVGHVTYFINQPA